MKIAFPVSVIILCDNSVWRTYKSKKEAQRGGMVRTPYIIKDAKGRRVPLDELFKDDE